MPEAAPEVYRCMVERGGGYGHAVDWWSLGVCLYELATAGRPYDIHSTTAVDECLRLFDVEPAPVGGVSPPLQQVIARVRQPNLT